MLAELREQALGNVDRAPGHPGGVVEDELLHVAEPLAGGVGRQLAQVLLVDSRLVADRRAEVQAPLAAGDHRGPHLGEILEALVDEPGALGRELERRVADHHLRVMGEDAQRVDDLAVAAAGLPVGRPHDRVAGVLRDARDPRVGAVGYRAALPPGAPPAAGEARTAPTAAAPPWPRGRARWRSRRRSSTGRG